MIGGFRSDLSIAYMIDGNFGNVFRVCFVFQSRVSTKTVVIISIKETKMFIPTAETLLSKWHKTCQIVQQNQETAQILRQTEVMLSLSEGTRSPMNDIISVM